MRKFGVVLLCLLTMVVMGCGTVEPVTPATEPVPSINWITTNPNLDIGWNFQYNKQLDAVVNGCKWKVVSGSLPTGIQLMEDGLLTGVATVMEETGNFSVEARKGQSYGIMAFNYKVIDKIWVYPSEVKVGNFYPGARAEYTIKVHNDYSIMSEQKQVTTESVDIPDAQGFISVPIPIRQELHDGSIANVLSLVSSCAGDVLKITGYDKGKNTIQIDGFAPMSTRIISVSYISDSLFTLQYEKPSEKEIDVSSMVVIMEPKFVLGPHETKEILVALDMPKDAKIDVKQFQFRVVASKGVKTGGGMSMEAAMAITWTVTMR